MYWSMDTAFNVLADFHFSASVEKRLLWFVWANYRVPWMGITYSENSSLEVGKNPEAPIKNKREPGFAIEIESNFKKKTLYLHDKQAIFNTLSEYLDLARWRAYETWCRTSRMFRLSRRTG